MRKIVVVALTCLLLVAACHDESRQSQPLYPEDMVGSWECVSNPDLSLEFGEHGMLQEFKQYKPLLYPVLCTCPVHGYKERHCRFGWYHGTMEDNGSHYLADDTSDVYCVGRNWLWVSLFTGGSIALDGRSIMVQTAGGSGWHSGDWSLAGYVFTFRLPYAWEADGDILRFTRLGSPQEMPFTHFELDDDTLSLAWDGEWLTFRRR